VQFFDRPSWGNTLGLAAGYVLQVLCCAYYGAFFTVAAGLLALAETLRTGLWRRKKFWILAGVFAAVSAACLAPYLLPFLGIHSRMLFLRPRWEVLYYSAELQHYLAVPAWNRLWGPWLGRLGGVEWQHFPGLAAIALSAWGFLRLRRRSASSLQPVRPSHPGRSRLGYAFWNAANAGLAGLVAFLAFRPGFSARWIGIKVSGRRIEDPLLLLAVSLGLRLACDPGWREALARRIRALPRPARAYVLMGGTAFVFSLGPEIRLLGRKILTGPYQALYQWVPGFRGLRAANRFSVLVVLSLALFAAYAVADALRRKPGRKGAWVVAPLAAWILVESWAVPLPLSKIPGRSEIPAIYRAVAALPEGASLLEIPMPTADSEEYREAWPVYYSMFHGRKLVNGYSGYAPPVYRVVRQAMRRFPDKPSFDLLERLGIGYILVRTGDMSEAGRRDFLRAMLLHRRRADPVAEADGSILYRILPWVEAHSEPEPALAPVGDKRSWKGRSSLNPGSIGLAFDGRIDTYWTNGFPQSRDEIVQIDLGREERFDRVVLAQGDRPLSYPRNFVVETSLDGREWSRLDGEEEAFPMLDAATAEQWKTYRIVASRVPGTARYLRIRLTITYEAAFHWSIAEIDLYREVRP